MESNTNDRPKPVSYDIIIDGLVRLSDPEVKDPEFTSVALKLGKDEPISLVWSKLQGECCGPRCILLRVQIIDHLSAELHFRLPYCIKYGQGSATRQWSRTESKEVSRPYTEVEVVPKDIPSDYDKKRINVNDSFISFANLLHQGQSAKDVELRAEEPTVSANGAQKVVINNDLEIIFHRTLRMPDDNRLHQLPASLGRSTLFNVEEYADRLPPAIVDRGGLFFPMWQREAMWLGFSTTNDQQQSSLDGTRQHCKYALRIFVGHINAVSGSAMGEKLPNVSHGETKQDYVVVPPQRWVDGICVAPGVVRQFVAMPSKSTSLANLIPLLWHSQRCSYLLVRIDAIVIRKKSSRDRRYE